LGRPESASFPLRTARLGLLGYVVFVILAVLVVAWSEQTSFADIYWPLGIVFSIGFAASEVLRLEKARFCSWLLFRILVSMVVLLIALMIILMILAGVPWGYAGPDNSSFAWLRPYLEELSILSIAVAMHLLFLVQVRRELLKDEPA
jgi:hypothetical protein